MYKKILLPIDGSEHSMKATDHAIALAKENNAHIEIIHVYPSLESHRVLYYPNEIKKDYIESAEKVIAGGAEKIAAAGIQYHSTIKYGDAADIICNEAKQNGVDLIIMGSRGLNMVSRYLLGSVSTKVLAHATCPVLIVR